MPGIVGLITRMPREQAERELRLMIGTLCHESFYVAGMWVDEMLGVYVGWVAREGSFCDGMPLRNEKEDVVLVFSGEDFPEPGIVRRLKERGHQLNESGPSYLVHLYEEDATFPKRLNGKFHGLLVDRKRGTAALFCDRFGMQRVYFHKAEDGFYFAAEAKAILAVRPELRRIDSQGLGEFVACGSVLENRTLFEGVTVLPGGSKWVFSKGCLAQKETYFHPSEWENQDPLEPKQYYEEFREVFSRNLPRYFQSQERVAMSLTAGLDTRMIMAWQKHSPGSLPCYTFGGMFRDCRDVTLARKIASACEQPHEVIQVGNEFLSRFPHYAERSVYLTDGLIDVGRSPDLYLNERARGIAPVRMTGNYGGEILRQVRSFKPEQPLAGLFQPELLASVQRADNTFARLSTGHPVSFAVFKQCPWNQSGVLTLEQTQLSMRSPFLDNELVQTVFRAPRAAITGNGPSIRLIGDGNRDLLKIPTDRGLAGKHGGLLAAASRSFLEIQFKAEYAYDMGMPQWLAGIDHVASPLHFEKLFLGRHKVFHFRIWYRDVLSNYLQDTLLDSRSLSRPYVERKSVEALVRGHVKGKRNYTNEIHKLLTLEILHRFFVDSTELSNLKVSAAIPMATLAS
jgi:asparagine synthase (glutamine-hydrolysing)